MRALFEKLMAKYVSENDFEYDWVIKKREID
jgi:hypothetical protein